MKCAHVSVLLMFATLAACGGGGGGGSSMPATNPSAGSPNASSNPSLPSGAAEIVYVANSGSNDVSAFNINPVTGALLALAGSPFAAGIGPTSIAVDAVGRFAYVANGGSFDFTDSISAFVINGATGALVSAGMPSTGRSSPRSIAVDPAGRFVFTANGGSRTSAFDVSAFAINSASGGLSAVAGSPFPAGTNPSSVAVHPSGTLAFVTNQASSDVWAYTISAATGALAPAARTTTPAAPLDVALDPSGRFAYVIAGGVSTYAIDTGSGALVSAGPSVGAGSIPAAASVDPSGRFLYVANVGSNDVSAYVINQASGMLSSTGPPVAAGAGPNAVAVSRSGKFAFVSNFSSNDVSAYTIDPATGALSSIGAPTPTGTGPVSVATTAVIR